MLGMKGGIYGSLYKTKNPFLDDPRDAFMIIIGIGFIILCLYVVLCLQFNHRIEPKQRILHNIYS